MHSDIQNFYKLKQFMAAASENKQWQGRANAELRSVDATRPWLFRQQAGEFMGCMSKILGKVCLDANLADAGFTIPLPGAEYSPDMVDLEDNMAMTFSKYCMHLVGNRIARELWMFGWPSLIAGVGATEESGKSVIHALMKDSDTFSIIKRAHDLKEIANLSKFVSRSVFNLLPVKQLLGVVRNNDWQATEVVRDWVDKRFKKVMQSQIVEAFGLRKHMCESTN
jgi:hypothetical protein